MGNFVQAGELVWVLSYGAIAIDLLFIFYMTHRRTRAIGFVFVLIFHLLIIAWFGIGIFPPLMIVATLLFFGPDWPRRIWADVKARNPYRIAVLATGGIVGGLAATFLPDNFDPFRIVPVALGVAVGAYHLDEPFRKKKRPVRILKKNIVPPGRWKIVLVAFLCLWISVQIILPLRHFAIPEDVMWTNEGQIFGWRMLTRHTSSKMSFWITDPIDPSMPVKVNIREHLDQRQENYVASWPEMALQFAHYLERKYMAEGKGDDLEVRAEILISVNRRPHRMLIDPTVDLTQVKRPWFGHADWILPPNRSTTSP